MGLDMYLTRKTYIWEEDRKDFKVSLPPKYNVNVAKINYIEEEAIYWRKANMIHDWFVRNVQNDDDDCGNYYVSKDDLKKLYDIIVEVLINKKKAEQLLPTASGFFFGDTDYDTFYFDTLVDTKKKLKAILDLKDEYGEYYYHSSW